MTGRMLLHCRIVEKLGQGGMGEVYRAEDTNLSRQVAIKVLADEFAHDVEQSHYFGHMTWLWPKRKSQRR